MTESDLYEQLEWVDHTVNKRMEMSQFILDSPALAAPLLELAFRVNDPLSVKASWVLEFAARTDLRFLDDHLDYIVENLSSLKLESSLRPMAKICEALILEKFNSAEETGKSKLNDGHLEQIAIVCFDWLIGPHKVATKAFAMSSLYELGKAQNWIHTELQLVLEKQFSNESGAFKARGRHILKKLAKQIKA